MAAVYKFATSRKALLGKLTGNILDPYAVRKAQVTICRSWRGARVSLYFIQIASARGKASFRPGFCMSKKKYPIISLFVAVVWAAFFYPADRAPIKPDGVKSHAGAPPVINAAPADAQPRKALVHDTMALSDK